MLRTARLLLRRFTPEDEEALFQLWNDPHVRRHLWDDQPVVRQVVREQIALSLRNFQERGFGVFTVRRVERPEGLIGFCGLRHVDARCGDVELLYGLAPHFWGQGLATEAARAVLRFGFEQVGLDAVFCQVDPANAASLRVMERLGMSPAGARRVGPQALPVPSYGLRREDFQPPEA